MQEELQELKLSTTARGHALQNAKRFVSEKRTDNPHALEEAFAGFEPAKDLRGPTPQNAGATAAELTAQLRQIEAQRLRLQMLLDSLEQAE
ncbi:MAG: hypothetical protein KDA37_03770 [Planctomycetales bacterium]|nr:hypothetical protein [Planctomycetales bacterium]